MSRIHQLKCDPEAYVALWVGHKLGELRFNDRDFQVGDEVLLRETQYTGEEMRRGSPLVYTGRTFQRCITHIQQGYGLIPGWVMLSLSHTVPGWVRQSNIYRTA